MSKGGWNDKCNPAHDTGVMLSVRFTPEASFAYQHRNNPCLSPKHFQQSIERLRRHWRHLQRWSPVRLTISGLMCQW